MPAHALHLAPAMNSQSDEQFEVIERAQLEQTTGGGIGSMIGGLFGEQGAKWGGFADGIIGQIQGMIGKGGGPQAGG